MVEPHLENQYGSDAAYYAASENPGSAPRPRDPKLEQMLSGLLRRSLGDVRESVFHSVKRWNLQLRDLLRSELALRLNTADDRRSVRIHTVDGLPAPMLAVAQNYPTSAEWWALLNLPKMKITAAFLPELARTLEDLLPDSPASSPEARNWVEGTGDVVSYLQQRTEKLGLLTALTSIDRDVLGAYFFRVPEVQLYWVVIGLFASMVDVPVEDLTVVVLIHELAHAYTHQGKDIDAESWDTAAFSRADLRIVEGIAQFYTQVVCERLAAVTPGPLTAFKKLLELQPDQYRVHQEWTRGEERAGEITRACLIATRSRRICTYDEYVDQLERIRKEIR